MRILLVEDTTDVGEAIVARLHRLGHDVEWERRGDRADDRLRVQAFDLLILDINLPGMDGLSLLRGYRDRQGLAPILMLTARLKVDDRIKALDHGADDYLTKPFDYGELEARARALLRRRTAAATNQMTAGNIVLDRHMRLVRVGGEPVELTRRELTLLEILMAQPGRIFPKEELVDQLFGLDEIASDNAVEQYVARLRKKLVGASDVQIRTLRGLGYQLLCR
ncbi:two-component system, OmpR family, response regulator TctD [Arboricoccus pini]|uniref:Two-component system, OmpR family, response regulator TctD n=1 Tax=Arboricoccus pini TaxID=1963835 RepID=A0A212RP06_9PROT|nr:response regulator transcription factor [Arboricoccus pini]SNB74269.1 two-component system, OmpR family, response regulator TctD [Arboricoccus pini]